ncbi:MAG: site-specific DNA-methyltransferase [Lachnospiraceae bacterium]|jgi:DNA modification methylase|nr:site-specific DNA-methyltransferase [Lachnospiraceae bacterium]MCI8825939.1 site-specific DNA-methyltransferase [Lachnospiraceae bacterium]MCI9370099.1 site-specific DNA-methyltransferase [Lachnospiraceae bacterium]
MLENTLIFDDSLSVMKKMDNNKIDLIYLDPPFYTQDIQKLVSRESEEEYSFSDKWNCMKDYLNYMKIRLYECKRILKDTGNMFVHCDRNASHYLKVLLDEIFGIENFQSEIVWCYKRWSNSKKGLLNNHQIILFYSKSSNFKFNKIFTEYSETTNIDQILQERIRDEKGKSVYKYDENGEAVLGKSKKGVPLSDVWDIPYLNPKAKERVGYPTQKPIILLERIIKLVTDENDIVFDPFMGSGTTLVAAKMLNRRYIGIDISEKAVKLAEMRLNSLIKTDSYLLKKGKSAYRNLSENQMNILKSINATPVQRNSGIDGFLTEFIDDRPVSVKIQKDNETLDEAVSKLCKSSKTKKCIYMILIRTHLDFIDTYEYSNCPNNLFIIDAYDLVIKDILKEQKEKRESCTMAI